MPGKELAIVIPVFNEARNVVPLVAALHASLHDTDWEVIFVDDDSPDGTADIVRNLALQDERVRLILRVKDRGLSQSCIQGLLSTKADILCVMDGDGQHSADVIPDLVQPLRSFSADIVSAARKLDARFVGLFLTADLATRVKRVGQRQRDASDATPEIAELQEKHDLGPVDWAVIDASGTAEQTLKQCELRVAHHAAARAG
jgi:dolichol-phosphate mannosyltransferase